MNPDKPFVLRVDASGYAIGATLEQLPDSDQMPSAEDAIKGKTVPVAFLSRKLTGSQKNWVPREQETYAIILALLKWETWIGLQPVLVLTDHKAIESWAPEVLDTPSGPVGQRARWHQIFSRYDLTIGYCPGKENGIADVLSRWAYPASQALRDTSVHGSEQDRKEMEEMIRAEREEERGCMYMSVNADVPPFSSPIIRLKNPPLSESGWIRGKNSRPIPERDPDQHTVCVFPVSKKPLPVDPETGRPLFRFKAPQPSHPVHVSGSGAPPPEQGEEAGSARLNQNQAPIPEIVPEVPVFTPATPAVQNVIPDLCSFEDEPEFMPEMFNEVGEENELPIPGPEPVDPVPAPEILDLKHVPQIPAAPRENDTDADPEEEEAVKIFEDEDEGEDDIVELTTNPQGLAPLTPHELVATQIPTMNWAQQYEACPVWGSTWKLLSDPDAQWPDYFRLSGPVHPYMLCHEKICIPLQAQRAFIRYHHDTMAHVGFVRLWKHMQTKLEWADHVDARKFARLVGKQCDVCQSCSPIPRWKIGMEPTLVPATLMTSVALDIFKTTKVVTDEGIFDAFVLCVDRLSGWIVAEPGSFVGLTGEWAAKKMFKNWRMFGIPNVITSDQGSQFISSWWKTMCALLGI